MSPEPAGELAVMGCNKTRSLSRSCSTLVDWHQRRSERLVRLANRCPPKLLDWSIHISTRHKFVYFDNQKVASGTIKQTIFNAVKPNMDISTYNVHKRYHSPLFSPSRFSDEDLEFILFSKAYFKFGFVRHPFTRLLSAYLDKIQNEKMISKLSKLNQLSPKERERTERWARLRSDCLYLLGRDWEDLTQPITFKDFVDSIERVDWYDCDPHWKLQWLNLLAKDIDLQFVGKFESLEEDLSCVLKNMNGGSILPAQMYATSAGDRLRELYSQEIADKVRELYRTDFELFDYGLELPIG